MNAKVIYTILTLNNLKPIRKFLAENGVTDPINFFGLHRPDAPWITQTMPGASVPVDVIPPNVTCTGPIVLSPASAESSDLELVQWLQRKPTILVNLGSAFRYGIRQTESMIATIRKLLDTSEYQILWKYSISPHVETVFDWQQAVKPLVDTGRVRVSTWLTVDPPALLQSSYISAFVTHGGANGYHEALEYVLLTFSSFAFIGRGLCLLSHYTTASNSPPTELVFQRWFYPCGWTCSTLPNLQNRLASAYGLVATRAPALMTTACTRQSCEWRTVDLKV